MKKVTGILISLILAGCQQTPATDEAPGDDLTTSNTITLSRDQLRTGQIGFGEITRKILSKDIKAKGKLVLRWQKNAVVGTMIGGTVESIFVNAGDFVTKGKLMATLTSPEIIEVQQEYISTKSLWEFHKAEYERQKLLNTEKINADKRLEEAARGLTDLDARHQSLIMQMEMFNIPIDALNEGNIQPFAGVESPISGTVEEVNITIGQFVEPNKSMFQIIDKSNLLLELRVFEKDVPFIRVGQRVTFTLANLGPEVYEATVSSIGRRVEEDARTVKVIANFDNSSPFVLPGMFASAEIHTDEQEVDALPEEAVAGVESAAAYIFYTLSPDDDSVATFHRMQVSTGFSEEGFIQVTPVEPLPPGSRVVIKGSYFVKSEELKQRE